MWRHSRCVKGLDGLAGTHPLDKAGLAEAKNAGFDLLEPAIGTAGALSVDSDQAACEAIRSAVKNAGFSMETLASGMSWSCNPVSNDPDVRGKAVELHKKALERASWLGCQALLFVPGVVT